MYVCCRYVYILTLYEQSMNHIFLNKRGGPRCYAKSPTARDIFVCMYIGMYIDVYIKLFYQDETASAQRANAVLSGESNHFCWMLPQAI